MGDDKNAVPSVGDLASRMFRASALILGAIIALNLAVAYLRPLLPWIVGGVVVMALVWLAVAILRWRRSRW